MRLDARAHTDRPWRVHEVVPDFDLADVWALPTAGGSHDLARLAHVIASSDESLMSNPLVRVLFGVRMRVGALLGWDDAPGGADLGESSVRERLPADLRDGPRGPDVITLVPFPSVFLTDTEWVAECSSRSVHMVQHVGWLPDGSGGYRGQLATLVRPKGRFGALYLRAIMPFRRYLVSPALVRSIGRDWTGATAPEAAAGP
jgi:hypothetical protein